MDLTICYICLEKNEDCIEVFGVDDCRGNIQSIVDQHFSFKVRVLCTYLNITEIKIYGCSFRLF